MKKLRILLTTWLLVLLFAFGGCADKKETTSDATMASAIDTEEEVSIDDKEVFSDDLMPLDEEELKELEDPEQSDDSFSVADEPETDTDEYEVTAEEEESEGSTQEKMDTADGYSAGIEVEEDGTYTQKEEVAAYIYQFGHLPSNYLTKKEAQKLGWKSSEGNLWEVAPGKCIGGDKFGNYEKMLPEEEGRTYYECDVNYNGGYRGEERLVYSDDRLIFYTGDHYNTFEQVY